MRQTTTFKDAIIAGFIGSLCDSLLHIISMFILNTRITGHYINQLFFPKKKISSLSLVIGEALHLLAGSIIGTLYLLVIRITGQRNAYFKALILCILFWLVHIKILPIIFHNRKLLIRTKIQGLVDLIAFFVYGTMLMHYLLKKR